jgi:hypothetical protein
VAAEKRKRETPEGKRGQKPTKGNSTAGDAPRDAAANAIRSNFYNKKNKYIKKFNGL